MSRVPARRLFFVHYVSPSGQVWTVEVCSVSTDEAVALVRRRIPGTAVWAGL
jgi:hypothetical protein